MTTATVLAAAQTLAQSSTITVAAGTPVYVTIFTDTGVAIPDGVDLGIYKLTVATQYAPYAPIGVGAISLNSSATTYALTAVGTYKVYRQNIAAYAVNVGVQTDS
jgi:hypothetical protein